MIANPKPVIRIVLYEGERSTPFEPQLRFELSRMLLEKGFAVSSVRPGGQVSPASESGLIVLGQFDDANPSQAQSTDGKINVRFRDVTGRSVPEVIALVDALFGEQQLPRPGGWKPWFPVIDYGRCTNCMQCLSFCLFDVYGVSTEGKIQVRNENHCKTDCPACSRVCPEVAILFPKYRQSPINGDEVNADDLRREGMKVDISSLLGGDIYQALRDRSEKAKSRFSKERDEDRALKERQRCLAALQQKLEIPMEVLTSLPSAGEIQVRAEQARKRAADALKQNAAAAESIR